MGALAHEHRLSVYRLLVEQGPEGLPAGVIAERVGLVPSSLTFHVQAKNCCGRWAGSCVASCEPAGIAIKPKRSRRAA